MRKMWAEGTINQWVHPRGQHRGDRRQEQPQRQRQTHLVGPPCAGTRLQRGERALWRKVAPAPCSAVREVLAEGGMEGLAAVGTAWKGL